MNFKNEFERHCFEIARDLLGASVRLEHNKRVQIESALFPEVASFKGPPTKEVDVLAAELLQSPRMLTLLVSCKEFEKHAEPAHVQEWAAVTRTLNNYSDGTQYLRMIVSANGFTSGCELWATSHNLGLIPPLKGRSLAFRRDATSRMFKRTLLALHKRVCLRSIDLHTPPAFFDFVYSIVADFEGHDEVARDGRYYAFPEGWISSFGEMYSALSGHRIRDVMVMVDDAAVVRFGDDVFCRFAGSKVEFGSGLPSAISLKRAPPCFKNVGSSLNGVGKAVFWVGLGSDRLGSSLL